jgi:hypothetical protein
VVLANVEVVTAEPEELDRYELTHDAVLELYPGYGPRSA